MRRRLEINHLVLAHQLVEGSSDEVLLVYFADVLFGLDLEVLEHAQPFDVVQQLNQGLGTQIISVQVQAEFLKIFVFCEAPYQRVETSVSHLIAVKAQAQLSDAREGFQTRCKVLVIVFLEEVP